MTMTQLIRANELVMRGTIFGPKTNSNDRLNDITLRVELLVADFWVIGALIFRIGHGLCNAH